MTSSLRHRSAFSASPRRALVVQGEAVVGGVDLPENAAEFIEQFNAEYAAAGLWLRWPVQSGEAAANEGEGV